MAGDHHKITPWCLGATLIIDQIVESRVSSVRAVRGLDILAHNHSSIGHLSEAVLDKTPHLDVGTIEATMALPYGRS